MPAKPSSKPPQRGDAVWLDFDPQSGHEQAGRRPALILSPAAYNSKHNRPDINPTASTGCRNQQPRPCVLFAQTVPPKALAQTH
jgi:mRNA-degrading endonuclease toxin of MazEF toxin-antitoxin module